VQYIIGHTIDYDLRVLKCVPGFSDESHFQWKPIDVCKIARKCWPEFKEGRGGYKLTQIMEKLLPGMKEVVEQKAHGAMADVYFTYLILAAIIHQYEPTSWEDVYNLQF
jgi:DNA polymerase III alpha subunit (gram-positive type)